jgi:hypothetical protein
MVASAAGPGQDAQGIPGQDEAELDFLHIGPPTGGKDPFIPNGPAALDATMIAPATPRLAPIVAKNSNSTNYDMLVPFPKNPPTFEERSENKKVASTSGSVTPITPLVVELPAPAWSISGIVLAERDSDGIKRGRDVAILRDTAGSRRFVTVGDPVDNGYHVSAVLSDGVEIRNKKRTAMIHLNTSTQNTSESPDGTTTGSRGINGATTRAN